MKRFIIALISGLGLILGLGLTVTAPANANHPGGPYTGVRFNTRFICVIDYIQNPGYPVGDAANSYEPGVDTGYRTAAQGCADRPGWTHMRVYLYSAGDGHCSKVTAQTETDSTPDNHLYNRTYTNGGVSVWINQWYYAGCRDSYQNRARVMTRSIGGALGLAPHASCWGTFTIMDTCQPRTYWTQAHDKMGIQEKYSFG